MNICKYCGQEIRWRTIYGERIPLGCGCSEDDERKPLADKETITRQVRCPKCGTLVFFVRHNGGCVWLDDLGPPWPKHPCYGKLQGSTDGLSEIFDDEETEEIATLGDLTTKTDLGQRIVNVSLGDEMLEVYVWPDFWEITPAPACGEQIDIDIFDQVIKLREIEIFYWPIRTARCEDCGQLFLRKRYHVELCRSRKERHPR